MDAPARALALAFFFFFADDQSVASAVEIFEQIEDPRAEHLRDEAAGWQRRLDLEGR